MNAHPPTPASLPEAALTTHLTKPVRQDTLITAGALQDAIFNSANFSSIATDAKGVIQIFNVGAERMLGYPAVDVINQITPADLSDPGELIARARQLTIELETPIAPGFEAMVYKASRDIEDIYELTFIRKDGSRFPALLSVTALRNAHHEIIGFLLISTNNTARKQIEKKQLQVSQRLQDNQFYTRSLFESNMDALIITDSGGIITDVNMQMEELTGHTRRELMGTSFTNHFTDPEKAQSAIKLVLGNTKITDYELTACHRDGSQTVVSLNASTLYDRNRRLQGVFATARDITANKHAEKQILELALHDALTQLPNRHLLNERLAQSMTASKRSGSYSALMFMDLDNFKALNDAHGHCVGDLLLIEVAHRLSACVRAVDVVARFGGDEFVVILNELSTDPSQSAEHAALVAEKIRAALDKPFVLTFKNDQQTETTVVHRCTASIGVLVYVNHEESQNDVLKWADTAMYQAKDAGGNRVQFHTHPD